MRLHCTTGQHGWTLRTLKIVSSIWSKKQQKEIPLRRGQNAFKYFLQASKQLFWPKVQGYLLMTVMTATYSDNDNVSDE